MKKAFIIVDIQNDFLPGGNFAVDDGDQILPVINAIIGGKAFDIIVATKDWHPANHGSFASIQGKKVGDVITLDGIEQILWPDHCVEDTRGADFSSVLEIEQIDRIFYKGVDPKIDSYSTFFDNAHRRSTGLDDYLKENGISEIYIGGLATDYCVKFSVLDALKLGYKVNVIEDACKGINLNAKDSDNALAEMQTAGAKIIQSKDLF